MADLNGDGNADVIASNDRSVNVSVLLGDGKGDFAEQTTFAVGKEPDSTGVADFNGDGKLDLVAGNFHDNTVSILLNTTEGTFVAPPKSVGLPTYKLTVETSANENGSSAFVLTTQNVAAGTEIPFDLSGTISDADVLGGLSTGSFVIEDDGTATFPIKYIEDRRRNVDRDLAR